MSEKYDVVIIGAGIGGLVCGCYLAKAGLKVLIVEKHYQVGGYCTSFKRKGFTFDASVHYIGGARTGAEIDKLMNFLKLKRFIKLKKIDPFDNIVFPDFSLLIRRSTQKTIKNIIELFPCESENIKNFFHFLMTSDYFYLFGRLRNKTFINLLDEYFTDKKLKSALSVLLGNIGLSAEKISALAAVALYREFILDGGYYPLGGNQGFANSLNCLFKSYGGKTLVLNEVVKIITKNKRINEVILKGGKKIKTNFVVSNIDATTTFKKLLDRHNHEILKKLEKLELSPSAFVVYLGLSVDLAKILKYKCVTWKFSNYNINNCYSNLDNIICKQDLNYIVCSFPSLHDPMLAPKGKSIVEIFSLAPFRNKIFWQKNREKISLKMIKKAEEIIPNLSNYIEIKEIATPFTFEKYTNNRKGAIYGWASRPNQIEKTIMPNETYINNLYLVGHWTTNGFGQGGIASVCYAGRNVAEKIIDKLKQR